MAKKRDERAAAKAKKQKTILIIGGVLLLGVAAIQGPKLMGGSSTPESVPADTTEQTTEEPVVATGTPPTGAPVVVAASQTGAVVAGVALPKQRQVRAATGQLASFTLFEIKDPFIQQSGKGGELVPAVEETDPFFTDGGTPTDVAPTDAGSGGSADAPAADTPAPPPIRYATINLDGKPQQVTLKQKFPAAEPLFVLRSLKAKQAKIGVAGGSFDDGQAITLRYGKKVTLVNTATGVRYVLKLVYTGASAEVIEGFTTSGQSQTAAGGSTGASTATTTAAPTP